MTSRYEVRVLDEAPKFAVYDRLRRRVDSRYYYPDSAAFAADLLPGLKLTGQIRMAFRAWKERRANQ